MLPPTGEYFDSRSKGSQRALDTKAVKGLWNDTVIIVELRRVSRLYVLNPFEPIRRVFSQPNLTKPSSPVLRLEPRPPLVGSIYQLA